MDGMDGWMDGWMDGLESNSLTSEIRHLMQKCNNRTEHDVTLLGISFHQVTNVNLVHGNLLSRFELNFRRGWKTCALLYIQVYFATS